MGAFVQDLKYGWRSIVKRPGFSLIAVLTLAIGIGANSTVFTFLNAVLFEPIPFKDYEKTVFVYSASSETHSSRDLVSVPDFESWRRQSRSFDQMAAAGSETFTLTGEGKPERIEGTHVTANFFPLLKSTPALGRIFLESEEQLANSRAVVLSYGFWQRRFGGDPKVLGRTVNLDAKPYTIVGVMPRNVWFPRPESSVWIPLATDGTWSRASRFLMVFGKLKDGIVIESARSEMAALSKQVADQNPDSNAGWSANVLSLEQAILKDTDRAAMRLLITIVLFVLLIACANISNLLLSRAASRQKEISVRVALGATRTRVIRQLLTESLIIALAGGVAGLMIAFWGADALIAVIPHRAPPPDTLVNGFIFTVTMLLSVASAIVFGLAPAFEISKTDVNTTLKDATRSSSGTVRGRRFRHVLVVAEITLTLILLIGGGLVIRQTIHILNVDPGFQTKGLLTLRVDLPEDEYGTPEVIDAFYSRALTQLASVPGISSSASTTRVPIMSDGETTRFVLRGSETLPADQRPSGASIAVSPSFFQTLGIPIAKGRSFSDQDSLHSLPVAIVNETLVKEFVGNQDPVGQSIALSGVDGISGWLTIVGVAKDLMPANLAQGKRPQIYIPASQNPRRSMNLVVRALGNGISVAAAARDAIWTVDPNLPIDKVATVEDLIKEDFRGGIALSSVFAVFGVIALVLATIGIYGVVSYSAAQRTQEIGVRLALGASRKDVLRMVIGQGLRLILIGTALGLAGGFGISRVLSGTLVGVSSTDPLTFTVAASLLMAVALMATYLPAKKAMTIDPMTALRHE